MRKLRLFLLALLIIGPSSSVWAQQQFLPLAVAAPTAAPTPIQNPRREYTNPWSTLPPETIWPTPSASVSPTPKPTPGTIIPTRKLKQFLVLPFAEKDRDKLSISEGYEYSAGERAIHNQPVHYAIDINAPVGTKLYAPCSGSGAVRGRHTNRLRDHDGNFVLYGSRIIGFGLGNFVQIWCDDPGVYVVIAHMDTVDQALPEIWSIVQDNGDITPNGRLSQLNDRTIGVKIKAGDFIGTVGRTGLGWGDDSGKVYSAVYWDGPHAHFEVCGRLPPPGSAKDPNARWDPMGWYSSVDTEKRYAAFEQNRERGLFLEDKYHRIRFAK